MWRVSSNPLKFEEAVSWFRNRVPLTRAEWDQLEERARRRAFTVSGVAQQEVLEDVYAELLKAVEEGADFQSFKDAVGEKLERSWGKKGATRIETIFRTNVQSAYAAGRYAQLTDPDVLQARPFWMYDAVLDSRTSGVCRSLDGTVRPADDPFWDRNIPPRHFNCRSALRSLTRQQAEARGVTEALPSAPPAAGFGSRPDPEAWGRDWARGVKETLERAGRLPAAFLGNPPGPADYDRPEEIPATPLPRPLLPTATEVGEGRFLELLAQEWGGLELSVQDPTGAGVILSEALLGRTLGRKDKRERFLGLLLELIREPFEIWLVPLRYPSGQVVFQKEFIRLFEDERGYPVLLVAEQLKGVWTGFNVIRKRNPTQLGQSRRGFLRYPRASENPDDK